jgi:pimeloyl-ACP methyl ester carboxylesterase
VLLHPNGLCAGFFDPVARRLADSFRVVGVDLRGHGGSDPPRSRVGLEYRAMAGDVLAITDALGFDDFFVVGESLGGGVGAVVDATRPGVVRRLVMCEAIAFAPGAMGRGERVGEGNPSAEQARTRRAIWPDRESIRSRFSTRPPFDVVAPEALDAYLRWGFFDRADGQVEMACAPETEAAIYEVAAGRGGGEAAFGHLSAMRHRVTVMHGADSYLPQPWFEAQADAADVPLQTVAGGHFFLQEDTERAEALVRAALA